MDAAAVMSEIYGVWFLIGAALVFFMQAGFAMVETGFTRAKNAGNIIMKNLMDFCLGTVMFVFIGFTIMMSEDYIMGIIGMPNFGIFTDYANFPWSSFVFNLVFCATTATIVSGAMAERTKFSAYLMYSGILSAVIYPIEAGWVWNAEGWLFQMGFIDFAGSAAIHTVGGISALIGVLFLGPRMGKYVKNPKTGEVEVKAFPGHNLTIGALGVFILWFGWYGFNGAAATALEGVGGLGSIFLTTTIAPAVASVVAMFFTWAKNGKPDVSMTLNASLAGLVGITAGCASLDAFGAIMVGVVSGFLVVLAVEFIDIKLKIDDPVGAIAVHGANGIWGTLAVGLFAVDGGLCYGGGISLLVIQFIGIVSIIAWTVVTISIAFYCIKKFHGLRVSAEEEIIGLDSSEHGLATAYSGFAISDLTDATMSINENTDLGEDDAEKASDVQMAAAIPVVKAESYGEAFDSGMHSISIIVKLSKFDTLKNALNDLGVTGMTVTQVMGCGIQKGSTEKYRGVTMDATLLPKVKVEVVVAKLSVDDVVAAVKRALYTGHVGDGKIFVQSVSRVVKVRTGEENFAALQDVE